MSVPGEHGVRQGEKEGGAGMITDFAAMTSMGGGRGWLRSIILQWLLDKFVEVETLDQRGCFKVMKGRDSTFSAVFLIRASFM